MKELFLKKNFSEIDIQNLLSLPEKELEKKLALLKFNELLDLVLILPWEERAKVILYSPYPEGLVKNLPPQELFLTLKASSLDLSVELLSYAKGTQIQFMFDIDAWYKDRIKSERVASWLILLFQAGEDKVLEWLRIADWDFLIAIFQKFVKVYKKPDDMDLLEAMDFLPPYTLDDFYFIEFKNDALEFYFRRMIEIIREELPELYMPLMESIIWEIPIEVEERAYRWRNGRLADEGIPEYFEALDIYSYIHPKSIRKVEPRYLATEDEEEATPPINIMIYEEKKDELFIFKALSLIRDPKQIERIKKELAWITNKVVVVDHVVIDDIEQIRESLEKVWGALNLGLEYLSLENLDVAKRILEEHFLEDIFKVAQTTFKELRKFALELTNSKEFDSSLIKYLDQPYQGYLQGVLVKKINEIKLFQPQKIGTSQEYVVFRKYNQIRMVRRYIEEIGYIAPLIQKAFGSPLGWIQEVNKIGRNFDAKFITWSSLILTALAYWIYNKEFAFKALPRSAWEKTFKELVESKGNKVLMKDSIKEELYKNFENLAKAEWYLEPELLRSFLNFVINKFENEFAYVDLEDLPDPKYQTLILIDLTQ
ncbi:MAG: hypothetical protein DRP29_00910 [Thermodesulfobacteriota bacterium]|nr:MAG: hypothetical protein DRP29_00910 [Thermodesulfobacteriota bacterium]